VQITDLEVDIAYCHKLTAARNGLLGHQGGVRYGEHIAGADKRRLTAFDVLY
jgi:hypothetical protein